MSPGLRRVNEFTERVWKGREEGWGQKQEVFSDSQEVRRCRIMKAEGRAHQGDVILQAQVYQEQGGRAHCAKRAIAHLREGSSRRATEERLG